MLRSTWNIFATAYSGLLRDDGLALAGNIAFCMILALFPFLILLTALAGFFGNEALAQTVVDYLLSVAPEALANSVSPEIHYILTAQRTDLLTLSVLLTIWTASGAVESIRVGLNRAYGYEETRGYLWRLAQIILFVIGGAMVLMVLAFSIVLGPVIWLRAIGYFSWLGQFENWFHLLRGPISFTLLAAALLAAHLFLPVKRHRIREILPGIILTMVMWLVAAFTYSEYLTNFSTIAIMYQSLAGIIIALIFLYFSGALAIWGGEINQALIIARSKNQAS
jgi:membrane protein